MNLKHCRSVKYVGATLICAAGLLTASFALAGKSGGGGHHDREAELKDVECDVEGNKIEVWGEVKGPTKGAKIVLEAKGKAVTKCINPADKTVEAQGDKEWFEIKEVEKVGEIDKREKKDFEISAKVDTDAKCEGKENWDSETKLEFKDDEFTVKLVDKKTGEVLDKWTCEVKHHDCECKPAGSDGHHH